MDRQLQSSTGIRTSASFLKSRVEEISDDDTVSPRAVPQLDTETTTALQPVVQSRQRSLVARDDTGDQSFILVQRNPRMGSMAQNESSRADHSLGPGQTLDGDIEASTTGLQTSVPSAAARRPKGQRSAREVLPRGSRIRVPLPSWSDIPRNQQMDLRSIARNFELIDRILSACLYKKDVIAQLVQVSLSEKFAPGLESTSSELSVARFRLACKERQQNLTKGDGIFQVSMVMTSPETELFFRHPSEELPYYLASQFDLPYWKVVLNWLSAMYHTKDLSYDFVRLIIYALESLIRSILHDLQASSIKNDAHRPVVDGIDCRVKLLLGLLDDAFPKKPQSQNSDGSTANTPFPAKSETKLIQSEDTKSSKNSEQEQDPSVTALILISTIITIPFVGMGWAASDHKVGNVDSNFWFLIPSALIQIIGVVVVARSLWRDSCFTAAWAWVWVWLGITSLASIASIVFYVKLPSEWSSFASYLAAAAQSLLGVQLMFAIPKTSKI